MSDEQPPTEEPTINPEHPWVEASLIVYPQPIMSVVSMDAVEFTGEDDVVHKAALLTVVDPTGVKTTYLPPQGLADLMRESGAVMQQWAQEMQSGIIVADKNMERQVTKNKNHLRSVD